MRSIGHNLMRGVGIAAAALLLPHAAFGQACIGSPAFPGQFALGGSLVTADGMTGYGAEARTNPAGPLAITANIGIIDVDGADDDIFTAGAGMAWEISRDQLSICPVAGVQYSDFPTSFLGAGFEASSFAVPVGLAAGARLGAGTVQFIPSGELGLRWERFSYSASAGGVSISESETETDLYLNAGATAVTGRFFGRAALERIFHDDAENMFRFSLGVLF